MKLFLSYHFDDEDFAQKVNYYLRKQPPLEPYCYGDEKHRENWVEEIGKHLDTTKAFLLFLGAELGGTQEEEARIAYLRKKKGQLELRVIELPGHVPLSGSISMFEASQAIPAQGKDEKDAYQCAKKITESLLGSWTPDEDLPVGYPFKYEKDIIKEYSKDKLEGKWIERGCPRDWPMVTKNKGDIENLIGEGEIGLYPDWDSHVKQRMDEEPQVLVAALTEFPPDRLIKRKMVFTEARPRKFLYYPTRRNQLTVGVLVSGGIDPGINAVIVGIVERQFLYAVRGGYATGLTVRGYHNGLGGLYYPGAFVSYLRPQNVEDKVNLGGSILGTSRVPEFLDANPKVRRRALERVARRLHDHNIDILYIIGGDGSMRAAHAIWKTAKDLDKDLSVVAIPKTMDNDILWVWQSFGFLSAVEQSKQVIQQLHTEAESNPRLCVIQLFGSDSGFVVTHAVSASGECDLFLIPEVPFTMRKISAYITQKLEDRYIESGDRHTSYGMVVMAETAIPQDARDYLDDPEIGLSEAEKQEIQSHFARDCRVFGQTPDDLRSGGLKLVSRGLQQAIQQMSGDDYWQRFRVFTNEPRHLIRAIPPSSSDIIFGRRLGSLAVDCAMAGYTDFMISQWLTEYVMVPLKLVTLGRKRIPETGIFYKAARASTGQPANLA